MPNINWQADLEQLAMELPKLHKNFFSIKKKKRFMAA